MALRQGRPFGADDVQDEDGAVVVAFLRSRDKGSVAVLNHGDLPTG